MKKFTNKIPNDIKTGHIKTTTSSKSKIKKITQNIKKRRETGNTPTLEESNPHSKRSVTKIDFIANKLTINIKKGIKNLTNKLIIKTHIKTLINK